MKSNQTFVLGTFFFLAMGLSSASALTNGPVSIAINGTTYSIFYTTIQYGKIAQNMTAGGGASPTGKYSLTNPNPIDGLGTNTLFMQPWWSPGDSSTALAAATAWYNSSGWPINDGQKYPNGGSAVTPFFVYGTTNAGARANYVAIDSTGATITGDKLITELGQSFALAGVSN